MRPHHLPQAVQAERQRALIHELRRPAPSLPDWAAEREARDARRTGKRLGIRINCRAGRWSITPLVDGRAAGRPLRLPDGRRVTVFAAGACVIRAAGDAAGLPRSETERRIGAGEFDITARGVQ